MENERPTCEGGTERTLHAAVLDAAHRRCTALQLLHAAVPFRSQALPGVLLATAVAPFMPVAAFAPATFPSVVSVLEVRACVRPAQYFADQAASGGARGYVPITMPDAEAANLRRTLAQWKRPLVALTLTTGRRSEGLPVGLVLGVAPATVVRTLRSLTLNFIDVTGADVQALAGRCAVLQSLHFGPLAEVAWGRQTEVLDAVLDSEWGGIGITTLFIDVEQNPMFQCSLTEQDFLPRAASLPLSPPMTVRTLRVAGVGNYTKWHFRVLGLFNRLKVYVPLMSSYFQFSPDDLVPAAAHGVVEGSTIERIHMSTYVYTGAATSNVAVASSPLLRSVVAARRQVKDWRRACRKAAAEGIALPPPPKIARFENLRIFAETKAAPAVYRPGHNRDIARAVGGGGERPLYGVVGDRRVQHSSIANRIDV